MGRSHPLLEDAVGALPATGQAAPVLSLARSALAVKTGITPLLQGRWSACQTMLTVGINRPTPNPWPNSGRSPTMPLILFGRSRVRLEPDILRRRLSLWGVRRRHGALGRKRDRCLETWPHAPGSCAADCSQNRTGPSAAPSLRPRICALYHTTSENPHTYQQLWKSIQDAPHRNNTGPVTLI